MNLAAQLVVVIPLLFIIYFLYRTGYHVGYHRREGIIQDIVKLEVKNGISSERMALLVKGEKIGFEKGFEAGESSAQDKLRDAFISFLKNQVDILENQLPAPESPQWTESESPATPIFTNIY